MDGNDSQETDMPDSGGEDVIQEDGLGNDTFDPGGDEPAAPDREWEDTGVGEFGEDATKSSDEIIIYDFGGETRNLPEDPEELQGEFDQPVNERD